jgi:hypothetical protein
MATILAQLMMELICNKVTSQEIILQQKLKI